MGVNIKKIIQETIEEYIDNIVLGKDNKINRSLPTVYQLAFEDRLPSIFRNGYSREYFASAGGNFYCSGVYTTFNLESTIKNSRDKAHLYGGAIVKLGIKSYDRFFICNKRIAKEVYGVNYEPANQLKVLFKDLPNVYESIVNSPYYPRIISTTEHYTSNNVQALLSALGGMQCRADGNLEKYDIRGFVFHGANDGDVAIIRDPKSIIPLAFSTDGAKTWNTKYFSQRTIDNSANDHDPITFLGKDFDKYVNLKTFRFLNGFMRVQRKKDNKFNFFNNNKELLFPNVWFDDASSFDSKGKAMVRWDATNDIFDNGIFWIDKRRNVYSDSKDRYPEGTFDELLEQL